MRQLRQLEEENRRLKAIVADQALDLRALHLRKADASVQLSFYVSRAADLCRMSTAAAC